MPQRKPWTSEEDDVLKELREVAQIVKWSTIAKKMAEQYNMPGRTGKQCRQRYHNHLDARILRAQWTPEQQQHLYKLHDQIGNKWAIIAQKLPGRTDNCVKNHFYSKMRKALRKLNRIIYQYFKKQIKQIKMTVLYKIVQATDQRFKTNSNIQQQLSEKCCKFKNALLNYSNDGSELQKDIQKLKELAKSIHEFSSKYRRKTKKTRRPSAQDIDLLKIPKFQPLIKCNSECQQNEEQQYSFAGSFSQNNQDGYFEMNQNIKKLQVIKQVNDELKESVNLSIKNAQIQNPIINKPNNQPEKASLLKPPKILNQTNSQFPRLVQGCQNLQQVLRNNGILQNQGYYGTKNQHANTQGNHSNKASSLADSVRSMQQEFRYDTNFLSQSIQKMRIGDVNFVVQLEDQHKLFVSN